MLLIGGGGNSSLEIACLAINSNCTSAKKRKCQVGYDKNNLITIPICHSCYGTLDNLPKHPTADSICDFETLIMQKQPQNPQSIDCVNFMQVYTNGGKDFKGVLNRCSEHEKIYTETGKASSLLQKELAELEQLYDNELTNWFEGDWSANREGAFEDLINFCKQHGLTSKYVK